MIENTQRRLLRIVMHKNCFTKSLFGIRKEDMIGPGYKYLLKLGLTDKMNVIIFKHYNIPL